MNTLERELVDGLRPRRRRALVDRLRGPGHDHDAAGERRSWDRAIAAFRVLEDRAVSNTELSQVERWLFEDLADDGIVAPERSGARWRAPLWAGVGALLLAAVALLVLGPWRRAPSATTEAVAVFEHELQARGAARWSRPLALDVVCGTPSRPAASTGCQLDELLGFSARLRVPEAAGMAVGPRHLTVFGIDDAGRVLYYAPTPEPGSTAPVLEHGESWRALPLSVRLAVNHRPGRLAVFAIATPDPVDVATVDAWARALVGRPPGTVDTPPWHLRLAATEFGPHRCGLARRDCASAELHLVLRPGARQP